MACILNTVLLHLSAATTDSFDGEGCLFEGGGAYWRIYGKFVLKISDATGAHRDATTGGVEGSVGAAQNGRLYEKSGARPMSGQKMAGQTATQATQSGFLFLKFFKISPIIARF